MDGSKLFSTLEYLFSAFAGVMARVESLPLAHLHCTNRSAVQVSLGDFVRGRMGAPQSARKVDGLFESLLAEAFHG